MSCPACGTENRLEARFCLSCGAGLARVCPNGHPVPAGARFCDECGAAFDEVGYVVGVLTVGTGYSGQTKQAPWAERGLGATALGRDDRARPTALPAPAGWRRSVAARGATLREATSLAYEAAKLISFEGMFYRHDIAHRGLEVE